LDYAPTDRTCSLCIQAFIFSRFLLAILSLSRFMLMTI
jgi:hypothetical protein